MIPEEKIKMLFKSGQYDFLGKLTTDEIWKMVFAILFIVDEDKINIDFNTPLEEIKVLNEKDQIMELLKPLMTGGKNERFD